MTHPRTTRARRVAAALVATGATVAALTPAATLSPASAATTAKDGMISTVKGLPSSVERGDAFTLKVGLRNPGKAATRTTYLRAWLSRDTKQSADDMLVGFATAPALPKGGTGTTKLEVEVPEWVTSKRTLLVCTPTACTSAGTLRFPPPIRNLNGTLSGDLTFTDHGDETEPGYRHTWDHTQTVSLSLGLRGKDVSSTEIVSSASTWTYSGAEKETSSSTSCTTVTDETRDGSGTLEWKDSPNTDDVWGSIGDFDLRTASVGVRTYFSGAISETATGTHCSAEDPRTYEGADISSLDLVEVARTPSSRTYTVESWTADYEIPSDWDEVEGTLILSLDRSYDS